MRMNWILGIAVLAVGLVFLGFAFVAADPSAAPVSASLFGRFSEETTRLFALGAAAVVGGLLLLAAGRGRV